METKSTAYLHDYSSSVVAAVHLLRLEREVESFAHFYSKYLQYPLVKYLREQSRELS